MLFLPVVHDVLLLDDLQCKCDVLVLHLHLQIEITGWDVTRYIEPFSKQTFALVIAGKAQQTLTGRATDPFISESSSNQFYSSKAADPESSDDLQVVEGPR